MRSTAARAGLLAGAAALLIAIPALSQDRRSPESIFPPGFGDPQSLPPPEKATPTPRPPRDDTMRPPPEQTAPANSGTETVAETENGAETAAEGVEEVQLDSGQLPRPSNYFTVPRGLERPTDLVGTLQPGNFGLGPDAFARSNGFIVQALMQRLQAPLAS